MTPVDDKIRKKCVTRMKLSANVIMRNFGRKVYKTNDVEKINIIYFQGTKLGCDGRVDSE